MHPSPILSFTLFGNEFNIYLYGLFIAIGLIACLIVYYTYTKKLKMSVKVQDFIFICTILAIALGFLIAKLYQAIYNYIDTGVFNFYSAGITAMGGIIGGGATFIASYFGLGHFIFKGKDKGLHVREFNIILQCAPCSITIAHAFGRLGCLMAGCCHGEFLGKDYVFGGLYMKGTNGVWGYYIPTQLYESLFLFVLFAVLSILYFKKSNFNMSTYLIAYGIWRIIIEIFRDDYRGASLLGLSPSQWQSVIYILGGIAIIVILIIKKIPPFGKRKEPINKEK